MCSRLALHFSHEEIQQDPALPSAIVWIDQDKFEPKYNIPLSTYCPILVQTANRIPNQPSDIMHSMKWGLVFAKDEENERKPRMNARSESLLGLGWKFIKERRRCAVVCHGYYAWFNRENVKLPYFVKHVNNNVILLAGLYNTTFIKDTGTRLWSFTIVTTEANKAFTWLQDRQPVVLSTQQAIDTWLDISIDQWTPNSALAHLIEQHKESDLGLQCYQVPQGVGRTTNQSPSFILPVQNREDGIAVALKKQGEVTAVASQSQRWKKTNRISLRVVPPSQCPDVTTIDDDDEESRAVEPEASGSLRNAGGRGGEAAETQDVAASSSNGPATQSQPKRLPQRTARKRKLPKGYGSKKITTFFKEVDQSFEDSD